MSKQKRPAPPMSQKAYDDARIRLVLSYAPPTHACKKCGWPCVTGYCCGTCGDNNPTEQGAPDA
jgi:hypothetical protein